MIQSDATKGINNINYFHDVKWERKINVEKEAGQDDSPEGDAKNRQEKSYGEALENMLSALGNDDNDATPAHFKKTI